jgi:hypothetical protein
MREVQASDAKAHLPCSTMSSAGRPSLSRHGPLDRKRHFLYGAIKEGQSAFCVPPWIVDKR